MDKSYFHVAGVKPDRRNLIVVRANKLLESHSHFKGRCGTIEISQGENGQLLLNGKLPNYYLKQLAQECLRNMELPIQNEIIVVSEIQASDPRKPR